MFRCTDSVWEDGWLDNPVTQWRMAIEVKYEGPFERLECWLWTIDRRTHLLRREVASGSLRGRLAILAEALDRYWRNWYVRRGRWPSDRWLRRMPDQAGKLPR